MTERFTSEFYAANRARLKASFKGASPIIITAHGLIQQGGDYTYRFHQDGSFLYLTGIHAPDVILVMDKGIEYLILPERSDVSNVFDGVHDAEMFAKQSGVKNVLDAKSGWEKLTTRLKKVQQIATLAPLPEYISVFGFYPNPSRAALMAKITAVNPSIEALDLRQQLGVMRTVKQQVEIDAIQDAVDVTIKTLQQVKKKLPLLEFEYQVEGMLDGGFRSLGSDGVAFDTIVASGKSACTLHHMSTGQPLQKNSFVLLDVGAQVDRYAADISRTYFYGDTPSKRHRQVHQAVIEVQDYAFSLLKPGALIRDNEKLIEQFLGEKLRSLGLIKKNERDEVRKYFPHATSHYLGLDVHDGGDYSRPLEPGVVLTVEPGIYIPEEGIGIRIEDDVIITEDGYRTMSAKLSRDY